MVITCRSCGNLFNKVSRDICPQCLKVEQERFVLVRTYLRTNRKATMVDVVKATGVSVEEIADMMEQGRLQTVDMPNLTMTCEGCGTPTQEGRYCKNCKEELLVELAEATEAVRHARHSQEDDSKSRYFSRS